MKAPKLNKSVVTAVGFALLLISTTHAAPYPKHPGSSEDTVAVVQGGVFRRSPVNPGGGASNQPGTASGSQQAASGAGAAGGSGGGGGDGLGKHPAVDSPSPPERGPKEPRLGSPGPSQTTADATDSQPAQNQPVRPQCFANFNWHPKIRALAAICAETCQRGEQSGKAFKFINCDIGKIRALWKEEVAYSDGKTMIGKLFSKKLETEESHVGRQICAGGYTKDSLFRINCSFGSMLPNSRPRGYTDDLYPSLAYIQNLITTKGWKFGDAIPRPPDKSYRSGPHGESGDLVLPRAPNDYFPPVDGLWPVYDVTRLPEGEIDKLAGRAPPDTNTGAAVGSSSASGSTSRAAHLAVAPVPPDENRSITCTANFNKHPKVYETVKICQQTCRPHTGSSGQRIIHSLRDCDGVRIANLWKEDYDAAKVQHVLKGGAGAFISPYHKDEAKIKRASRTICAYSSSGGGLGIRCRFTKPSGKMTDFPTLEQAQSSGWVFGQPINTPEKTFDISVLRQETLADGQFPRIKYLFPDYDPTVYTPEIFQQLGSADAAEVAKGKADLKANIDAKENAGSSSRQGKERAPGDNVGSPSGTGGGDASANLSNQGSGSSGTGMAPSDPHPPPLNLPFDPVRQNPSTAGHQGSEVDIQMQGTGTPPAAAQADIHQHGGQASGQGAELSHSEQEHVAAAGSTQLAGGSHPEAGDRGGDMYRGLPYDPTKEI